MAQQHDNESKTALRTNASDETPDSPAGSDNERADQPEPEVPMYRNPRVIIPLAIILAVIGYVSWRYYVDARDYISTDDAYIDGNRVAVSSKILGRIDTLIAAEGDTVREGQTLVRLNETDLRAQESQAQSAVALAHESIALAQVSRDKAQSDFDRASTQYKQAIIPKEQFEHAQSELDAAKARLAIARAQEGSARAQLGITKAQLSNMTIAAPMTGVVAKRWLLEGDIAQPGQAIYSIYDTEHIWVTANYEETSLGSIAPGDSVEIKIDTYPDRVFHGVVLQKGTYTASQFSLIPPNNASGNFTKVTQRVPVKISIERPADTQGGKKIDLLVGMSVEVKIKVH
ncbi:MAG TPA: HlyD family secretion protein [Bacteroidota bacterium]|nr:HlyD family secretion protein [Bacteroidota bacterium]